MYFLVKNYLSFLFLVLNKFLKIQLLKYKKINIVYISVFLVLFFNSINILELKKTENLNILEFLRSKSDFEDYYQSSIQLKNKKNPYYIEKIKNINEFTQEDLTIKENIIDFLNNLKGVGTFLYPPLFAFLLIPLTNFSYNVAGFIFQFIQLVLFILSVFLLYKITLRLYPMISKRKVHYIILISILSLFPLFSLNASNGNIGFLLNFFIIFSFYLYIKNNKILVDIFNGIVLGISIIIKVLPGFLGGFYFIQKRFTIILGIIIGIILGIVMPSIYLGWDLNLEFYQNWYNLIIKTYEKYSVIRPYANNQTISAALCKLFIPYSDLKQFQYGLPINVISIKNVTYLIKAINIFILLNIFIISVLYIFSKKNYIINLYYIYLVFLGGLLTSGISWYHAYSILFLVYFLFFLYKVNIKDHNIKDNVFLIPVFYLWIFWFLPSKVRDFLSLYSVYTWIHFIIIIYICLFLYKNFLFNAKQEYQYEN